MIETVSVSLMMPPRIFVSPFSQSDGVRDDAVAEHRDEQVAYRAVTGERRTVTVTCNETWRVSRTLETMSS